ncbi:fused response regulator/phosphatase [Azospirillum sp. BE72]|uniref:PP2C family protein-serine/threonine phosphatase n=1 Tax=Azospirillum sp. BE72 TaxID=2817776 RepID=UPI00285B468D|nr:fused response regulator/phosphatase [Azospirillum sp. BE72]MDR6773944.1 sigma-B regulation protein RsbU (phosphoserine phosphatase) [Azospirillum sp. BE72]
MASGQLYALDLGQPLGDRKVLIADNSLYDQRILSRFLHWAGITRIACVSNGPELLSCIGAFDPDLLVIDADLACADDLLALCRELRSNPRWHDLPILVQGAQMTDQMRTLCFQAGATDLLGKPVNPGECIARVRYHLERRSMVQELRAFRERVGQDLGQARAMQLSLAPEPLWLEALADRHHLAIAPVFETSDEVGGDFWTAFEIDAERIGVFIADLSGHGIAAAINAFRLHTLLARQPMEELMEPARLLTNLNQRLSAILAPGQFATAFYGVIDRGSDRLHYAGAGSPPPLLARAGGLSALDSSGLPLGIMEEAGYVTRSAPFRDGDALFLYSDAMTEAQDADDAMLGDDGLADLVALALAEAPAWPLLWVMTRFTERFGTRLCDDLTALWIARQETPVHLFPPFD